MHRYFGRWKGENEPTFTDIHVRKLEDLAKEFSVGLGVLAVDYDVRSGNQGRFESSTVSLKA